MYQPDLFQPKDLKLWDIQEEILGKTRIALSKSKKVVLCAPTGSGKTIMAVKMIKNATKKGLKCIFVCDRIRLVKQTSDVFNKYGIYHGIIQGENTHYDDRYQFQICSIQTLQNRGIDNFDFAIYDEIHTLYYTHTDIMEKYPNAYFIGLSASPFTKGLGNHFDELVYPYTTRDLIDRGYLVDMEAYGINDIDTTKVPTQGGDFKKDELERAADKAKINGNIVETWKKLASGKKTMVFCCSVAHSKHVAREFQKQGIAAVHIDGYPSKYDEENKDKIYKDFVENRYDIICSVDLMIKGIDITDVECISIARPTKSLKIHVQMIGRGLRTHPGKTHCIVLDHAGNFTTLGWPDGRLMDGLDDGIKKEKTVEERKKEIERLPTVCPSCNFLKKPRERKCLRCGFLTQFMKDVESTDEELQKLQRKEKRVYSIEEKQSFLGGLNSYARDKNMKKSSKGFYGWAIHTYKEKFGVVPSNKISWSSMCKISEDVKKFITYKNIRYAKRKT